MSNILPNGDVNKITAGTGIVTFGAVGVEGGDDAGYLDGSVNFNYKKTPLDVRKGLPKQLLKTLVTELTWSLEFSSLELSAATLSRAIGGDTIATTNAAQVTRTMQAKTMAPFPKDTAFNAVILDGPNVATGGDAPVVKDAAEAVTYVEGTDYIVDYTNGFIVQIPGGAIGNTETLHITYKYTPYATKRVKLGKKTGIDNVSILFIHYVPDTDKYVKIFHPKVRSNADYGIEFKEDAVIVTKLKFEGIPYAAYDADAPHGYFEEQT